MLLLKIFKWYFKRKGWKIRGGLPAHIKKCILIAAPHTSNWDFVFGLGAAQHFELKMNYLMKQEVFRFPFKNMLLKTGGLPVNRAQNTSMVDAMVELINSKDELVVLVPPEGTRKAVDKWKTGFYYTALKANIPIVLGHLDYNTKEAYIGDYFLPSGDIESDFKIIKDFYKTTTPKHPHQFNLEGITPKK